NTYYPESNHLPNFKSQWFGRFRDEFAPYEKFSQCKICRQKVHQPGSHYCQACAYKKGICAMCGKKLLDTKNYKQSSA
ncbi:Cysteine-rich PDZ-binding protein, partial [Araneus ventricosus]